MLTHISLHAVRGEALPKEPIARRAFRHFASQHSLFRQGLTSCKERRWPFYVLHCGVQPFRYLCKQRHPTDAFCATRTERLNANLIANISFCLYTVWATCHTAHVSNIHHQLNTERVYSSEHNSVKHSGVYFCHTT